jgi:hypothetical protein
MICAGDLEASVGCWALLGIDLRGDNSGEKYVDAATLKPNNSTLFLFMVLCQ